MTTASGPRDEHGVNLAFVLLVHFGVGFFWLFAIGAIVGSVLGSVWGVIWGLSALGTWLLDSGRIVSAREDPARAWGLTFLWWLKSFVAPFALAFDVYQHATRSDEGSAPAPPPPPAATPPLPRPPGPPSDLGARLDDFARRLAGLEEELRELRRVAAGEPEVPTPAPAPPTPPPPPPPTPRPAASEPRREPPRPPAAPPRRPSFWDRELTLDDLFGAKALAWAGGVVTLLGIVFFFVLAVNRGWIGPTERVGLGTLASAIAFGAGLWLRRAYGPVYSALAAAGAGIAGGYATLLAATALYELIPRELALLLAAAIAGVATATALAWSSELIAGLGLVGAMLAPAAIALQDREWSSVGTDFAALMFLGAACVAVYRRWEALLAVSFAATIWQVGGLAADASATDWDVVAVAGAFWLLYLGAAVALQLRLGPPLRTLPSTLALAGALLAGLSTAQLFEGDDEGWVLLAVGAVHGLAAAGLFVRRRDRDLSAFLGAVALGIGAVAVALLLDGPALTIAWAAEAAVLAWLARRAEEHRYQLVSLAYLGAAAVHALFWDAPLEQLYQPSDAPANGVAGVVAVAVAGVVFARYAYEWIGREAYRGLFAPIAPLLEAFRASQRLWRSLTAWGAALAGIYAASLGVLALGRRLTGDEAAAFDWSHVGVTGLWGAAALGTLALGHRRGSLEIRGGGLVWLGAVLMHAVLFDVSLDEEPRGYAFLVAAASLLVGALLDRLVAPEDPAFAIVVGLHLASVGFAVAAVYSLLGGDGEAYGLLALAALHCGIAVIVRTDRDLATLLWAPALVVAGYAASLLLTGTALVLAWALASSALVALADWVEERRLQLASSVFLGAALVHTLGIQAPPADLFEANASPADGIPALLICIAALAVFGFFTRGLIDEAFLVVRPWSFAAAALLGIYAGSLAILGVAEALGQASVATDFQRGHSGVSAFWGAIGLVALYLGLRRGTRWLRICGFALFGLALVKLFVYDLAFLSSITRALSFLAVGAVLLFGGFLVQRLGEGRDAPG